MSNTSSLIQIINLSHVYIMINILSNINQTKLTQVNTFSYNVSNIQSTNNIQNINHKYKYCDAPFPGGQNLDFFFCYGHWTSLSRQRNLYRDRPTGSRARSCHARLIPMSCTRKAVSRALISRAVLRVRTLSPSYRNRDSLSRQSTSSARVTARTKASCRVLHGSVIASTAQPCA